MSETEYTPDEIECPNCGKTVKLKEDTVAGTEMPCPECEEPFVVEWPVELSLTEQLAEMQVQRDEFQDQWQRALAELENYRRRVQKEHNEQVTYQSLPLARDLLPGLDNLQRALQAADAAEVSGDLVDGVRMVAQQFDEILARHGIESIAAENEPFDPAVHEAVQQVASADREPMTILQEIERGYRLGDRVVRPSKVIVVAAETEPPEETNGGDAD